MTTRRRAAAAARPTVPAPEAPAAPSSALLSALSHHPQAAALCCFFLSGATGLIYEVVWSRRLTLIFGTTVLAVSTVLAVFLGGLAAGSLILGRLVDRRRDPLRVYAVLEGAVGLVCFATPWLFTLVEQSYLHLHPLLAETVWGLRLLRFLLCALVLFLPTALMGGTLPALSRAVAREGERLGGAVALLYGVNTLGAVAGALAGGFVLIPIVGIRGTIYFAAVLNLGVALIAYALYSLQTVLSEAPPAQEQATEAATPRPARFYGLLLAYGVSGAAALIYEVGWTRLLALAFGTSTYAFSAMLAAFLAGLGLGSLASRSSRRFSVDRLAEPLLWFALIEAAIALSVTLLTPLLDRLPFAFLALHRLLGPRFWALQFGALLVCTAVMLVPAALMGYAFPLVTRLATEHVGLLGRRLAAVYSANTFGTVVGSFAAGFLLIPLLGVQLTLTLGVLLNSSVAVAYLVTAGRQRPRAAVLGLAMVAVAVCGCFALPRWDKAVLSSGAYVYPTFYESGNARKLMQEKQVLYYRDAMTTTVSVTKVQPPGLEQPMISLQINGKTDASTGDLSTQLILAHLPALLHREPKSVLTIGLASGCTLGALELYDEVRQIDCVEIEPEMARVTRFFRDINHDCLADPRVNLVLDDARSFVQVTDHRYDAITSEPSNPWISGVANLFTREHFENCRRRLNPGGVLCQWVPLYNLSPQDVRSVVATFTSVFPNSSLWVFPDLASDAYLIGTVEPLEIDAGALAQRLARPKVAASASQAHLGNSWDVLGGMTLPAPVLAKLAEGAPLHTDDHPLLEFSSPAHLYSGVGVQTLSQVLDLGRLSQVTVPAATAAGGRYSSPLAGVCFGEGWRAARPEALVLQRDLDAFAGRSTGPRVRCVVQGQAARGRARLDFYCGATDAPGEAGFPALPAEPPSGSSRVGAHETRIYSGAAAPRGYAWAAFWTCPARQRAYALLARPPAPPPQDVLKSLGCLH